MQVSGVANFRHRFDGAEHRRQPSDSKEDNTEASNFQGVSIVDDGFDADFASSLVSVPTAQANVQLEEDGSYQVRPSPAHSSFGASVASVLIARW